VDVQQTDLAEAAAEGARGSPPAERHLGRRLDMLNAVLADVRDGLGPYLAIYLLTVQHWDQAAIGAVLALGGGAGIVAQTPAGALVDRTRAKRAILVAAAVIVTGGSLALPWMQGMAAVGAASAATSAAGALFAPALSAITLGIVGPRRFARRMGRNEAFNHAGNAAAAAGAATLAWRLGPMVVFWLMGGLAVASIIATLAIPAAAIDDAQARGLDRGASGGDTGEHPSGWSMVRASRPLLVFAACVALFHLANAAMLPLVGQKLALANAAVGTSLMAVCIIAAQVVMVPVAMLAGVLADRCGRKPVFLAGFAILALRGLLYPLSDAPWWLVGVQLLDGVGAGVFGTLFPVIVRDLTRGTGHFNACQGAVATAQGAGAALSSAAAGVLVAAWGYGAAFVTLGAIALAGAVVFLALMPETGGRYTLNRKSITSPSLTT